MERRVHVNEFQTISIRLTDPQNDILVQSHFFGEHAIFKMLELCFLWRQNYDANLAGGKTCSNIFEYSGVILKQIRSKKFDTRHPMTHMAFLIKSTKNTQIFAELQLCICPWPRYQRSLSRSF